MTLKRTICVFFLFITLLFSSKSFAISFETKAKQAILIDTKTGAVLFEHNADEKIHPSSMTKIMTIYYALDQIEKGRFKLDDEFLVSERAWKMTGTRMFLNVASSVSIKELLLGAAVSSGNDACVVLAEGISGSEGAFSKDMTDLAHKIGATNTNFLNASGINQSGTTDADHLTTVRDLSIMAFRTIEDFPKYYSLYGQKEFAYNNVKQENKNPLLYVNMGADGLKTGYTDAGGYGLVASAVQRGRRLIMVVNGLATKIERAKESENLMSWGFREFTNLNLFKKDQLVGSASVWLGEIKTVDLTTASDIELTVPYRQKNQIKAEVVYSGPLPAPIQKNDKVAELHVTLPSNEVQIYPLVAMQDVKPAGFFEKISATIQFLLWGKNK